MATLEGGGYLQSKSFAKVSVIWINCGALRVDHWDIERERIVVLTDCKIVSVKYDFIHGVVEELKRIVLSPAYDYTYGDFKYPNTYF